MLSSTTATAGDRWPPGGLSRSSWSVEKLGRSWSRLHASSTAAAVGRWGGENIIREGEERCLGSTEVAPTRLDFSIKTHRCRPRTRPQPPGQAPHKPRRLPVSAQHHTALHRNGLIAQNGPSRLFWDKSRASKQHGVNDIVNARFPFTLKVNWRSHSCQWDPTKLTLQPSGHPRASRSLATRQPFSQARPTASSLPRNAAVMTGQSSSSGFRRALASNSGFIPRAKPAHTTFAQVHEQGAFPSSSPRTKDEVKSHRDRGHDRLSATENGLHSSPASTKSNTQAKVVFDGLSTAHNLITMRSARNGDNANTQVQSGSHNEQDEYSLPLQKSRDTERSEPVALHGRGIVATTPASPPQSKAIFNNIKQQSAFASSPATGDDRSNALVASPAHNNGLMRSSTPYGEINYWNSEEGDDLRSSINYPGNDYSIYHSSLGAAPSGSAPLSSRSEESPSHAWPLKSPEAIDSPGESTRDGSTITNIYKHYIPSEVPDKSSVGNVVKGNRSPLKLADRKVQKSTPGLLHPNNQHIAETFGQPPKFALPAASSHTRHGLMAGSSQGMAQSASYGDTRKLLEITEPTNSAVMKQLEVDENFRADYGRSGSNVPAPVSQPIYNPMGSNNPFRFSQSPNLVISNVDGHNRLFASNNSLDSVAREPLERDVSKALRRASAFSSLSVDSISSSILDGSVKGKKRESNDLSFIRRQKLDDTPPIDARHTDNTWASAARAQAFYDQNIVADTWRNTNQHNKVRILINQPNSLPDSPPDSPSEPLDDELENTRSTEGDWETVGESIFGLDFRGSKENPGMLGGGARRAGSSIANVTDDGTTITEHVPEISDFDSTDRIAQHPAAIGYSGDYRQRDLKDTHIPVILPVFGEHKINGFLADSNRVRPSPHTFNRSPPALKEPHRNPFKSTPPRVGLSSSASRSTSNPRDKHSRLRHIIQAKAAKDELQANKKDAGTLISLATTVDKEAHRAPYPSNWTESADKPSPNISDKNHPPPERGESYRPNSWLQMMDFIDGGSLPGSPQDKTKVKRGEGLPRTTGDGVQEIQKPARVHTIDGGNKEFVDGPPGAFYAGVNNRSNAPQGRKTRRKSSRVYPTNKLRPLSLLTGSASASSFGRAGGPGEFSYRSPLAPINQKLWAPMYSSGELEQQREYAKKDGFGTQNSFPLVERGRWRSSRVVLNEPPTLYLPRHMASIASTSRVEKQKISNVVFGLCNLFPPLLGLYAWGYLDNIMCTLSYGEFETFGRKQKLWAARVMFMWLVAVVIGLVVGLALYFRSL